ncbi:hypothetical protein Leryth_021996 [Lithospermum erythrorhizon]|nr:hypothetical protein Leryth_021996 [Lithospermum erythrorhizon]
MSRRTFKYICSLVEEHMTGNFTFSSGMLMSVDDQVAVALRRLGSEAIEETGLHHIRWPSTEQEMEPLKSKFEKIHGLPNCCGVIDMTHITMTLPSSQQRADVWRDHMNNHSMLLQAIVDPNFRFIDVFAGMPGKMNEMEMLQNSNFYSLCEKGKRLSGTTLTISEDTELREYIIGKEAYPLLPWLIRPYHEITPTLSEQEAKFNDKINKAHAIAKIALRNLKERWKLIQGPMWRPDKNRLPRSILVCCILHNILIDMEGDMMMNNMSFSGEHDPGYDFTVCESIDHSASVLRNKLSKYLHGKLHY